MSVPKRNILFLSTLASEPWGGSELLWHTAALRLAAEGHAVTASVCGWPQPIPQLATLRDTGVVVSKRWMTPDKLRPRSFQKLFRLMLQPVLDRCYPLVFERWLGRLNPDLICVSKGWVGEGQRLMDQCLAAGLPYAVIIQAASEKEWPGDEQALKLTRVFQGARRVFFVSERNRALLETQLGVQLTNAEVVRNPFKVSRGATPAWPATLDPLRLACVGRLNPEAKGQDLLLQLLAEEPWRSRPLMVSFYGKGHAQEGLSRLAKHLGVSGKVRFCGHIDDIESLWAEHHALVLPSRHEGLPIAVVEAMLCARPAVVTDVAGNAEVVEDEVTGFVAEAPTVKHLGEAMERAWSKRQHLQEMGAAAARRIRQIMPEDPAGEFAKKLLSLAANGQDSRY